MALNTLKQPFIRLNYSQGTSTYFYDEANTQYKKLVGSSASDATWQVVSPDPTNGNVIPPSATVFVTFPDNSTMIINNLSFFGKPESGNSESTIKLATGSLPSESQETQLYNSGDVVLAIDVTGTNPTYELGICTGITTNTDSGVDKYYYTWKFLITSQAQNRCMKVVDSIPTDNSYGDYQMGDVIGVTTTYYDSGVYNFDGFKMYVCTNTYEYEDSGVYITQYTWQEIMSYPNT